MWHWRVLWLKKKIRWQRFGRWQQRGVTDFNCLLKDINPPSYLQELYSKSNANPVGDWYIHWRRTGKSPLLLASDDSHGVNITIIADLELPMRVKIPENLAMAASMSQLQHTTANHLFYSLLGNWAILWQLSSEFTWYLLILRDNLAAIQKSTLLLLNLAFSTVLQLKKGQMLKANGSQACLSFY